MICLVCGPCEYHIITSSHHHQNSFRHNALKKVYCTISIQCDSIEYKWMSYRSIHGLKVSKHKRKFGKGYKNLTFLMDSFEFKSFSFVAHTILWIIGDMTQSLTKFVCVSEREREKKKLSREVSMPEKRKHSALFRFKSGTCSGNSRSKSYTPQITLYQTCPESLRRSKKTRSFDWWIPFTLRHT